MTRRATALLVAATTSVLLVLGVAPVAAAPVTLPEPRPGTVASQVARPDATPDARADDPAGAATRTTGKPLASVSFTAKRAKHRLKTLVVPVYWKGAGKDRTTRKQLAGNMATADRYYRAVSNGRYGFATRVQPWTKVSFGGGACAAQRDPYALMRAAIKATRARGVDVDRYDRLVLYVTSKDCGGPGGGLGQVRGRVSWLWGTTAINVLVHELGHNFGVGHSNRLSCFERKRVVSIAKRSRCSVSEYIDPADMMGAFPRAGWMSASHLVSLGWLKKSQVRNAAKGGTYTVRAMSAVSTKGVKALRIKVSDRRTYWVEYRSETGVDTVLPSCAQGLQVRMVDTAFGFGKDPMVVDMYEDGDDFLGCLSSEATSLPPGSTWTSPEGVRIQLVRQTAGSARVVVERGRKASEPSAPADVTVSRTSEQAVTVRWSRAADGGRPLEGYRVYVYGPGGRLLREDTLSAGGTTTSLTVTDPDVVRDGQQLRARVVALNELGRSAASLYSGWYTHVLPPAVPVGGEPGAAVVP